MKINQIITEKRKEKKLTQESLAEYLGVSTPAVNKWEKGNSYPDITLLPALARVLGVDLNTLLSFKHEPSEVEISNFVIELSTMLEEKGYDFSFQQAITKISEYPNSDLLINAVASFLLASINLADEDKKDDYEERIDGLFTRIINSNNSSLQSQAKIMLISRYLKNQNYEKAEELINSLPDTTLSKDYLLAEMHIQKNEYDEALELLESKMLLNIVETQSFLLRMIQISKDSGDTGHVCQYAEVHDELNELFDINQNIISQAQLEMAIQSKDIDKCIELLEQMVSGDKTVSEINNSNLFRHIKNNTVSTNDIIFQTGIIEDIKQRDDTEFIKSNEKFLSILKSM